MDRLDMEKVDRENARRNEEVAIVVRRRTVEAIQRALNGEPQLDTLMGLPLSKERRQEIVRDAQGDLASGYKNAQVAKKKKGEKK